MHSDTHTRTHTISGKLVDRPWNICITPKIKWLSSLRCSLNKLHCSILYWMNSKWFMSDTLLPPDRIAWKNWIDRKWMQNSKIWKTKVVCCCYDRWVSDSGPYKMCSIILSHFKIVNSVNLQQWFWMICNKCNGQCARNSLNVVTEYWGIWILDSDEAPNSFIQKFPHS